MFIQMVPRLNTALLALGFVFVARPSLAQTYDTQFGVEAGEDYPCPYTFFSTHFYAPLSKQFFGRSTVSMKNYDEYHDAVLYAYVFEGTSTDKLFKIKGIHHVAEAQCTDAWLSALYGFPAIIAVLHHVTLYNLASTGCKPSTNGDFDVLSPPDGGPASIPNCTGGTGGSDSLAADEWYEWLDGVRFRCHRETDTGWDVAVCDADPEES